MGALGSDYEICNVNIGTSGAEIGGGHLVEKKQLEVGKNLAVMLGNSICDDQPVRSIMENISLLKLTR